MIQLASTSMPEALQSILPVGQHLGAAASLCFGTKTLRGAVLLTKGVQMSHDRVRRELSICQAMRQVTSFSAWLSLECLSAEMRAQLCLTYGTGC